MAFVLDASVAMSWCFADELNSYGQSVLADLRRSFAIVPALWLLEVNNVLLTNERRTRITQAGSDEFLAILGRLDIRIHQEELDLHSSRVLGIAREYRLTVYDATYLELALRQDLPLATRDKDLLRAAPLAGVPAFTSGPPTASHQR